MNPSEATRIGIQRGDDPVEVIECVLRWKEAPPGSGQLIPELALADRESDADPRLRH